MRNPEKWRWWLMGRANRGRGAYLSAKVSPLRAGQQMLSVNPPPSPPWEGKKEGKGETYKFTINSFTNNTNCIKNKRNKANTQN